MKKILVAEDDKFYASIYKTKLAKERFDVTVVGNGQEALEFLKEGKPDLVLLDLIMPEVDGFSVLEEVSKNDRLKGLKIIVMSNLGSDEDINKAKNLGASDYFVKSKLSIQEMIDKVKENL